MLKVVEGRKSEYYNHFDDYDFMSCEATDTRLMGVIALHVTWMGRENNSDRLYQVIHLDFSEYGVDDYFEYECIMGSEDCKDNKFMQQYKWKSFLSVMGGDVLNVPANIMMAVIDSAIPLAEEGRHREYDTEENREFRRNTLLRFDFMRKSLEERGTLKDKIDEADLIRIFSPNKLATCETINYFIMRLIDHDFVAAGYLSTMNEIEIRNCQLTQPGIQTLVRNNIRQSTDDEDLPVDEEAFPFRCKMTTLAENGYYYSGCVIYLDGDYRKKNPKVTRISVGSMNRLSEYEAALQLQVSEYITVFDCRDRILSNFDGSKFEFIGETEPEPVNNGWLYTVYNKDNSHVNKSNYWLNDDVYGYAILTIDGEFILMSNKLGNINYMDQCTITSLYAPFMEMDGRYQLNEPIFHTLCEAKGVMFRDLIEHPDAY